MTIKAKGERYAITSDDVYIGEIAEEEGSYTIVLEEPISSQDLKDLIRVVERVEKENDL